MRFKDKTDLRMVVIAALIVCIMGGCDEGAAVRPTLAATFAVTDTLGVPSAIFHSGENFKMSFSLQNTSDKTVNYYRGDASPDVVFEIIRDDSVVATSIDGYAFIQIPRAGYLVRGQTMQADWKAPTTPAQCPRKVLAAGSYRANVVPPHFEEADVKHVAAIEFTIF